MAQISLTEKMEEIAKNLEITKFKQSEQVFQLQQLIQNAENEIKKSEENIKFYTDTIKDYKNNLVQVSRQKSNAVQLIQINNRKFQDHLQDLPILQPGSKPNLDGLRQLKNWNSKICDLEAEIANNNAVIENLFKIN